MILYCDEAYVVGAQRITAGLCFPESNVIVQSGPMLSVILGKGRRQVLLLIISDDYNIHQITIVGMTFFSKLNDLNRFFFFCLLDIIIFNRSAISELSVF